jgi:hypothetical protein
MTRPTREQVQRIASFGMLPNPDTVRELARMVLEMDEALGLAEPMLQEHHLFRGHEPTPHGEMAYRRTKAVRLTTEASPED